MATTAFVQPGFAALYDLDQRFVLYHNTPDIGSITWQNVHVVYLGATYPVADGSSNKKYIWWDYDKPYVLQESDNFPTLAPDDVLVFFNKSGTGVVVPTASVVDGDLLVPGSVAGNRIAANQITGDHIIAGAILSKHIAAGQILANHIAAGAVQASHIAADAISTTQLVAGFRQWLRDSNPINGLANWGFEAGSIYWGISSGIQVVTDAARAHSGNGYLEVSVSSGQLVVLQTDELAQRVWIEVNPGDVIIYGGWAYRESGNGDVKFTIELRDKDLSAGSAVWDSVSQTSGAAWQQLRKTFTVPAGKKYVSFYCEIFGATTPTVARFDDCFLSAQVPGWAIVASSISSNEIAAGAITTAQLAAGAVTTAKIAAGAVTANEIAAGTITADRIASRAITADRIAIGTLTANEIAVGSITADRLNVSSLSAISANLGLITAGQLQDGAGSAGINLSGSVPAGWVRYLNLNGTGTFLDTRSDGGPNARFKIGYDGSVLMTTKSDTEPWHFQLTSTAFLLAGQGNAAGIALYGSVPAGWTRYLNLNGAGAFLKHERFELRYDGTAIFQGVARDAASKFVVDFPSSLLTVTDEQATPVQRVLLGKMQGGTNGWGVKLVDDTGRTVLLTAGSRQFTLLDLATVQAGNLNVLDEGGARLGFYAGTALAASLQGNSLTGPLQLLKYKDAAGTIALTLRLGGADGFYCAPESGRDSLFWLSGSGILIASVAKSSPLWLDSGTILSLRNRNLPLQGGDDRFLDFGSLDVSTAFLRAVGRGLLVYVDGPGGLQYHDGSGQVRVAGIMISTGSPSGYAPEGTLWAKV